jgi:glycosyltransferase involved in cell wall biosynthesis
VLARGKAELRRELAPIEIVALARLGIALKLYEFDANDYADFIWETLFSATLLPDDLDKMAAARYRTLAPAWKSMHRSGLMPGLGRYPTVDTTGYDIVFTQTPYPARLSKQSCMVVRYHDAIPMFLTHTIPTARFHRRSHYYSLLDNSRHAVFACTSQAARSDLLKMFPVLERRSTVVHDVVSHSYFPETPIRGSAAEIIRSRLNPKTEPKINSTIAKTQFYQQSVGRNLRFLLMVSSIEPRKNHARLVRAWEMLRARGDSELKLVLVGSLGWKVEPILQGFRSWQERGELFHLSAVPAGDLRQLFASAECVICPSIAEGFDLSGIEAMLCGAPVVASDIPVHREVYGDAAVYFDRYSPEMLAEVMGQLLYPANREQRKALCERGQLHAQQYRRDAIAPQWAALFDGVRAGRFDETK